MQLSSTVACYGWSGCGGIFAPLFFFGHRGRYLGRSGPPVISVRSEIMEIMANGISFALFSLVRCHSPSTLQAFSLIETTVAATIAAMFLSSLFTMNMVTMDTIRCAKESIAASQVLQQRMESMRIANWQEVTDATWLRDNLLNTAVAGSAPLKNLVETLTIVAYGSTTIGNTQLTRSGATANIVAQNSSLSAENAVKVIWTVNFSGAPNNRVISRQIVAILAKGGVAK